MATYDFKMFLVCSYPIFVIKGFVQNIFSCTSAPFRVAFGVWVTIACELQFTGYLYVIFQTKIPDTVSRLGVIQPPHYVLGRT